MGNDLSLLFCGLSDCANSANRISAAINAHLGYMASRVFVTRIHKLMYPEDRCSTAECLKHLSGPGPSIVLTTGCNDGDYSLINYFKDKSDAKLGMLHIGTNYRNNAKSLNDRDDRLDSIVRFISPDSMHLSNGFGNVYQHAMEPSVNQSPALDDARPIRIAHSPSKRSTKGTGAIIKAINSIPAQYEDLFEFKIIEGLSYEECSRVRAESDIFICQMNPAIGGFGYSAVEACASGMA